MINAKELLSHAVRCQALAETCSDPTVAEKFRSLAMEYRDLADHSPPDSNSIKARTCPILSVRQR